MRPDRIRAAFWLTYMTFVLTVVVYGLWTVYR
jgi:hypothetical protein